MSVDWTPGIRAFCTHWSHAPMLQQTFATLEREPDPVLTLEPFERFALGNALIDAYSSLVAEAEEEGGLRVTAKLPNKEEISLVITPAQLLFGVDREAYKLALNA